MSVDWPTLAGIGLYVGLAVCGDLLLSRGMRRLDASEPSAGSRIARFARHIVTTPDVIGGIACLALNFAALLILLTRADISLVGPSRAASYLLLTLLARRILHEQVTPQRWAGAALISAGVLMVLMTTP